LPTATNVLVAVNFSSPNDVVTFTPSLASNWQLNLSNQQWAFTVTYTVMAPAAFLKSLDGDCRRRSLSRETGRAVRQRCRLEEPGGKLWSIRILGAVCPLKSMTSVAASHCLVASCPVKAKLDPAREIA